jgi:hypothetical protein
LFFFVAFSIFPPALFMRCGGELAICIGKTALQIYQRQRLVHIMGGYGLLLLQVIASEFGECLAMVKDFNVD